jgi:hypothetical protein
MLVGDTRKFAIESEITEAYARPGLRALGFFVIHVGGIRYGVYESDATMLANSVDEVRNRLGRRGHHAVPFAEEPDPGKIADAFREAVYADTPRESFFGMRRDEFRDQVYSNHVIWAPDGDAAFDDGSYILQFDSAERVRLIAFRCGENCLHYPPTLRDLWIEAVDYYRILDLWQESFEREWAALPKKEV